MSKNQPAGRAKRTHFMWEMEIGEIRTVVGDTKTNLQARARVMKSRSGHPYRFEFTETEAGIEVLRVT